MYTCNPPNMRNGTVDYQWVLYSFHFFFQKFCMCAHTANACVVLCMKGAAMHHNIYGGKLGRRNLYNGRKFHELAVLVLTANLHEFSTLTLWWYGMILPKFYCSVHNSLWFQGHSDQGPLHRAPSSPVCPQPAHLLKSSSCSALYAGIPATPSALRWWGKNR